MATDIKIGATTFKNVTGIEYNGNTYQSVSINGTSYEIDSSESSSTTVEQLNGYTLIIRCVDNTILCHYIQKCYASSGDCIGYASNSTSISAGSTITLEHIISFSVYIAGGSLILYSGKIHVCSGNIRYDYSSGEIGRITNGVNCDVGAREYTAGILDSDIEVYGYAARFE